MGATPQPPSNSRDGSGVARWMQDIDRQLNFIRERLNSPFANTGLSVPGPMVTQVDGSLIVGTGEAKSGNYVPATSGWHLGSDGKAEFKDITLYDLPNSMLANPTAPGAIYSSLTNYGLTTTLTNIKTVTITVPAGFTQAAVSIVVRVYAVNPHTTGGYDGLGGDYLFGQANIAGYNGYALPLAVSGNGGSGTNISPFSTVLSGLTPGGTFTVQIAACTNYAAWAANASNTAEVSGSVLWFR